MSGLAENGWLGVNLFFVVSGFIILYAHGDYIGRPERLHEYAWRRFSRLYPVYWLLLTVFIFAAAAHIGPTNFKLEAANLISAYALVAFIDVPTLPLKVAWTLLFEVKFYVIFATLIWRTRVGVCVFAIWATAILGRNLISPPPDWGYFSQGWGLLHMWNINFICGMLACKAVGRLEPRHGTVVLFVGISCLVVLWFFMTGGIDRNSVRPGLLLMIALVLGLIVAGGVLHEQAHRWVAPGFALLVGDASYSIYLVHSAVISLIGKMSANLNSVPFVGGAVFISAFVSATIVGVVVHLAIERPLLRRLKSFWDSHPRFTT